MQVWDISPGYLNDAELLAQRELICQLLTNTSDLVSGRVPELQRRWSHCLNALRCVESWVNAECSVRQIAPIGACQTQLAPLNLVWPKHLDLPGQFLLLAQQREGGQGRIALPMSTQSLWTQHKYSVLARSAEAYHAISVKVAGGRGRDNFALVLTQIAEQLQRRPDPLALRNSLVQMWGYVAAGGGAVAPRLFDDLPALFGEIQARVLAQSNSYLLASTALSELSVWLESPDS